MIFVTVGTQGGFDRLIRTVDSWAGLRGKQDVFAQTGPSEYKPTNIRTKPFIDATDFNSYMESADLVIAHAGMGSIITALEKGKPIIVMPRRASLGEHRNDHQVATAKRFKLLGRILVAANEQELICSLDQFGAPHSAERLNVGVSPQLIATIRNFIKSGNTQS